MMNSSVKSCFVTNHLIPYIRKCGVKTRRELAELVQSKPDDVPLQVAYQALVDIEKTFNEYTAEVSNNCCLLILILTLTTKSRRKDVLCVCLCVVNIWKNNEH